MSPIHNRMPLILKQEDWNLWLQEDVSDIKQLFRVYDNELIEAHSVSKYVNTPANNTFKCIERVPSQASLF